jgi:hypothetical protein
MAESLHPAAPHHLPSFITAPGETDVLMMVMGFVLLLAILMFGILFFRLHSLPERVAHKSHKIQFEVVAVLCLIALFTHMHIFWVAALLLAMIDLPDFGGSLARIAASSEKIAGVRPGEGADAPLQAMAAIRQGEEPRGMSLEAHGGPTLPTKPDMPPARKKKEPSHA